MREALTRKNADPLTQYRTVREKLIALHHDLHRNYVPTSAMVKSAKRLGIPYEHNTFMFGSSEEMSVLVDYCLYDYREIPFKGKPQNAIEKRLDRDPPPPGSYELEILNACAAARYTLLVVESVEKGLGAAVLDAFAQERFFLTDVGFGNSAVPRMAMAARVVSPFGINMTTGTALPLDRATAEQIAGELRPLLADETVEGLQAMSPGDKSRMSATIIRLCLGAGAADRIQYAE
jgi:hypothetical protein